jgi:uncharacterized delta-60 repeat protein
VAIQADGKIVVAGKADDATGNDNFALARYTANGELDGSFSADGKTTTDLGGASDGADGVSIQADGRIVAAGTGRPSNPVTSESNDFALARYKTNGGLDTTFDGDGKQTTDVGGISRGDIGLALALQTDGKIVTVGHSNDGAGGGRFALTRHGSNGGLDGSFSGDGKTTTNFPNSNIEHAHAVVLQPNGRIVVGGYAQDDSEAQVGPENFALARYKPNGGLDTTFSLTGDDGVETTDFDHGNDQINGLAVQPDGKIVAGGAALDVRDGGNDFDREFGLARYLGG